MNNILIFGKNGFIGKKFCNFLDKKKVLYEGYSSTDINLINELSCQNLKNIKKNDYVIFFFSALTPDKGKDEITLIKNLNMIKNFFIYFPKNFINHFFYVSSDSVYNINANIISEKTIPDPQDLYGLMHLTREKIIQTHLPKDKITILRLTGVYGKGDTHSSYGPNRFIKTALKNNEILLFGSGKDLRNHLFIDDLINMLMFFFKKKLPGIFCLASNKSYSFFYIANLIKKLLPGILIKFQPNNSKITKRFFRDLYFFRVNKNYHCTEIKNGIKKTLNK
jgi:nucleoside-diphosphate-sugar epimerase